MEKLVGILDTPGLWNRTFQIQSVIFTRNTIPNAWKAIRRVFSHLRYKGIEPKELFVVEPVRARRLAICEVCEHKIADQCSLCTCYLPIKTRFKTEVCPDQPPRW